MINTPSYKDLVLLGGGHSHVQVIKMWAMNPLPGVRLSLVSADTLTPYSGMLPGFVAGHYRKEDMHIDLRRLCQYANVRFIEAKVMGLNLDSKEVQLEQRAALGFDFLSINTGITPDFSVPGSEEYAIPVKPIATFSGHWKKLHDELRDADHTRDIGVVGGGAAGFELILAMQHACREMDQQHRFHIIQKNSGLPESHPVRVQKLANKILMERGVKVHTMATVTAITQSSDKALCLNLDDKQAITMHHVFWCTQAAAAPWPRQSGLRCDSEGFISVNQHLQSESHPFVFASGDIAKQSPGDTPRAGVFAVRQGPVLFNNLRTFCQEKSLQTFKAQNHFLRLLSCGDQTAIACKPGTLMPVLKGKAVWVWKDRIDKHFMAMFKDLSPGDMVAPGQSEIHPAVLQDSSTGDDLVVSDMRCGGCGAKVAADTLSSVIRSLTPIEHQDIVLGLHNPDDASAIQVPEGRLLIQSIDAFRALIDDPFLMGKIAAHHALSDLFAMNATPHSALAIVNLPYGSNAVVARDLKQIMSGAIEVLNENGCALIGGHTSESAEMSVGFSVNGYAETDTLLRKSTPKPGDCLILTQPLGSGVLFAAHSSLQCRGDWLTGAIEGMLLSNRAAADIFHEFNASACTDVTGFGLAGHLLEMIEKSEDAVEEFSAKVHLDALPILEGTMHCFSQGARSSLHLNNRRHAHSLKWHSATDAELKSQILFDPQTSGGLLACVPQAQVDECLAALKKSGYPQASLIGSIIERGDALLEILV